MPSDASHLLVLQDDAWPCENFAAAARAAIEERPEAILVFFLPGFGHVVRPVQQARLKGERWLAWRPRAFVPLVAVVYPARFPREIVAFSEVKKVHLGRADDAVVGGFVRAHKVPVWATLPCLVEHRDELPSVMGMRHGVRAPHRLAAWFVEGSPALTDLA